MQPSTACLTLFPYTTLVRSTSPAKSTPIEGATPTATVPMTCMITSTTIVRRWTADSVSSEVSTGLGGRESAYDSGTGRSEEHTSELQSRGHLVCRLLLEQKH